MGEDVECGAEEPPGAERVEEGVLVDGVAPSDVDDGGVLGEECESSGVEEAVGAGGGGEGEDEVLGQGEDGVEPGGAEEGGGAVEPVGDGGGFGVPPSSMPTTVSAMISPWKCPLSMVTVGGGVTWK